MPYFSGITVAHTSCGVTTKPAGVFASSIGRPGRFTCRTPSPIEATAEQPDRTIAKTTQQPATSILITMRLHTPGIR
jgi:hypothetical protein